MGYEELSDNTLEYRPKENPMFPIYGALKDFGDYQKFIAMSKGLPGIKEVIYDDGHLKTVVQNVLRYRPANIRFEISYQEGDETISNTIDSAEIALSNYSDSHRNVMFGEGELNAQALQVAVDHAFGLNDIDIRTANSGAIGIATVQENRPLEVSIADPWPDSPGLSLEANWLISGENGFDQHDGDKHYLNDLAGGESMEFVINDSGVEYRVKISKEMAGGERTPGLDASIATDLLPKLGLPIELAENLGDLGPVYKEERNASTGDAF